MKKINNKKIIIVIVTLAILLAASVTALTVTLIKYYINSEPASVTIPGNIITSDTVEGLSGGGSDTSTDSSNIDSSTVDLSSLDSLGEQVNANVSEYDEAETTEATSASGAEAVALALHNKKPEDNKPFKVTNMFPGDRETKYYRIKVSYKDDITVRYHADIHTGYERLAEVLKVRIRLLDSDELLYDGLMRDMPKSLNHALATNKSTESELYYEITTYLETSVGNKYMNKDLVADFRWWVEETDNLDTPYTGDTTNIYMWICLAGVSLVLLLILLVKFRKGADDEQ